MATGRSSQGGDDGDVAADEPALADGTRPWGRRSPLTSPTGAIRQSSDSLELADTAPVMTGEISEPEGSPTVLPER
jgi:hypothetical protein